MASSSLHETLTSPGAPVQHAPHCVHSNLSPSSKKYDRSHDSSKAVIFFLYPPQKLPTSSYKKIQNIFWPSKAIFFYILLING